MRSLICLVALAGCASATEPKPLPACHRTPLLVTYTLSGQVTRTDTIGWMWQGSFPCKRTQP